MMMQQIVIEGKSYQLRLLVEPIENFGWNYVLDMCVIPVGVAIMAPVPAELDAIFYRVICHMTVRTIMFLLELPFIVKDTAELIYEYRYNQKAQAILTLQIQKLLERMEAQWVMEAILYHNMKIWNRCLNYGCISIVIYYLCYIVCLYRSTRTVISEKKSKTTTKI